MVPEYKKIRLRFRKTGDAKFISHLDLDRTMKSALTRAGIKVEHTHGFNPRPHLVFSLPTSVGTESLCEFLDIKAEEGSDPAVMKEKLNANLPPDIRVTDVYCPQTDFKQIQNARYELRIVSPDVDSALCEKINGLFRGPVLVEKRTKKTESGTMEYDISPFIRRLSCSLSDDGAAVIDTVVSADNASYINPEYIIKAICSYLKIDLSDPTACLYTVLRTEVYTADNRIFE